MKDEEIKKIVRDNYGRIAQKQSSCCSPSASCCGSASTAEAVSQKIGYKEDELKSVPDASNLGLGCGNPVALASLKEGEVVLDLGAGAGLDCFLAANKVGKRGKVIGVDMTPEMVAKARENARKDGYSNVEFRLGEIENLPVADNSVDIVISNCVINLVPDKARAFQETYRVLKPGGRLMISDIVLLQELPDFVKQSVTAYVGCVSGATLKEEYLKTIKKAGFRDVKVIEESGFSLDCIVGDPLGEEIIKSTQLTPEKIGELAGSIVSIKVRGTKPAK